MPGVVIGLGVVGVFMVEKDGPGEYGVFGTGQSSAGVLMPDYKMPSIWYIDENLKQIGQVDITSRSLQVAKLMSWSYPGRAIQVDSMTGNVYALKSFGATSDDISSAIYKSSQMGGVLSIFHLMKDTTRESINFAMDIKLDSERRRIWVADSGNSRVLVADLDSGQLEYIYQPDQPFFPVNIAIDKNSGGAYVRTYDRDNSMDQIVFLNNGVVQSSMGSAEDLSWTIQDGVDWLNPTSENIAMIISKKQRIPFHASNSMCYDHFRDNLWWLLAPASDTLLIYNSKNQMARSVSLLSELQSVVTVGADLETGDAFVAGYTGNSYGAILRVYKNDFSINRLYRLGSQIKNAFVLQYPNEILACSWKGITTTEVEDDEESSLSQEESESLSSVSSQSSSSVFGRDLTTMDQSAIVSPEYTGTAFVPGKEETMTHEVNTYFWGHDYSGLAALQVGVIPNRTTELFLPIDSSIQLPLFSWLSTPYFRKPMFVTVSESDELGLVLADQAASSVSVLATHASPILNGYISGLAISNDNGSVCVTGNGVVVRMSADANLLTPIETASSEDEDKFAVQEVSGRLTALDVSCQHIQRSNIVWCLSASDGTVVKVPNVSLAPSGISTYGAADSPFKLLWSEQHSEFIIAGGKAIYSLSTTTEDLQVRSGFTTQTLTDIDVSNLGEVAIGSVLDDGTTGFVRVVGKDFWTMVCKLSFSGGLVRKVAFANAGKLVVATESTTNGTTSLHMVSYYDGEYSTLMQGVADKVVSLIYDDIGRGTVVVMSSGDVTYLGDTLTKSLGKLPSKVRIAQGMLKATANSTGTQKKIRVYVGSRRGLNDRWDSGEIETSLTSMIYGGGNNLVPGQEYWVSVMVYYDNVGWSTPHEKSFWVSRS